MAEPTRTTVKLTARLSPTMLVNEQGTTISRSGSAQKSLAIRRSLVSAGLEMIARKRMTPAEAAVAVFAERSGEVVKYLALANKVLTRADLARTIADALHHQAAPAKAVSAEVDVLAEEVVRLSKAGSIFEAASLVLKSTPIPGLTVAALAIRAAELAFAKAGAR